MFPCYLPLNEGVVPQGHGLNLGGGGVSFPTSCFSEGPGLALCSQILGMVPYNLCLPLVIFSTPVWAGPVTASNQQTTAEVTAW